VVDSLSSTIRSYPATYANNPIHFKSSALVRELRSYGEEWDEIKDFYSGRTLENTGPIAVVPLEIHKNDEYVCLDIPDRFLSGPTPYDILEGIREQHDFSGWLTGLNGPPNGLYLVYVLGH
jgi:hypothetical protein